MQKSGCVCAAAQAALETRQLGSDGRQLVPQDGLQQERIQKSVRVIQQAADALGKAVHGTRTSRDRFHLVKDPAIGNRFNGGYALAKPRRAGDSRVSDQEYPSGTPFLKERADPPPRARGYRDPNR